MRLLAPTIPPKPKHLAVVSPCRLDRGRKVTDEVLLASDAGFVHPSRVNFHQQCELLSRLQISIGHAFFFSSVYHIVAVIIAVIVACSSWSVFT